MTFISTNEFTSRCLLGCVVVGYQLFKRSMLPPEDLGLNLHRRENLNYRILNLHIVEWDVIGCLWITYRKISVVPWPILSYKTVPVKEPLLQSPLVALTEFFSIANFILFASRLFTGYQW